MKSIANIAEQSVHQATERGVREASATTRKLFMLLHGAYGNQFLAKYHTGQLVESGPNKGKDKGLLTAMLVWDADLSQFPGDVVEAAAKRVKAENPDFAPTLPKLVNICTALMPVKTHAELAGYAMLPPPVLKRVHVRLDPVGDGLDWARVIVARLKEGDQTITIFNRESAMKVLGLLP